MTAARALRSELDDDPPSAEPIKAPDDVARPTPMMEQYIEIKTANPDCLLFYRMGDFYELFFEDAEVASRALGIMLTKRGKYLGKDVPLCGVPIHRSDEYLHRLIGLGHRVAVCEQMEDPAEAKKRGSKAVVRRDVVRLVTPGTLTEDTLLDARRNNYLLAVARARAGETDSRFGLAWIDISTGEFRIAECERGALAAEIARVDPGEILVSDALYSDTDLAAFWREFPAVVPLARDVFDGASAERRLTDFFAVATSAAFGDLTRLELTAAAACISYVERTQIGKRPPLSPPLREQAGATMAIDQATRANLELMRTMGGERAGSLLASVDRTVTSAGSRLLAQRLAAPLTDVEVIRRRHDAVEFLVAQATLRSDLRATLNRAPDLARALARIVLGRAGPRDLAAIRDGLTAAADLAGRLSSLADAPVDLADAAAACAGVDKAIAGELAAALDDELPVFKRDGGFIRPAYSTTLDETRALRDEARRVIAALQARYADETGIKILKIRHNNVLGYFVEVTAQHGDKLMAAPLNQTFIHRQTLAGQVRFTTTELGELEAKIASAGDRALGLELEMFERLAASITATSEPIKAAAQALAALDVTAALATLAAERDYVRPQIDATLAFEIEGGRHPVVEQALARDGGAFVANNCDLSPPGGHEAGRIWLLTGPNMAGKSTFLRQNALIALLAQMGSFVPAKRAYLGVVDRLFSRVGAADDLARGRSTFMVEMVETAAILNQAGARALVILDEIGRGTATFDGLSIAWASIEHLHDQNRCRSLFATHYHELTALAARLPRLQNATVKVKEWQGEVVFLHEVGPGAADRSYGIQVAKLAGLPPAVIARAQDVLSTLEAEDRATPKGFDDLPLFAATPRAQPMPEADPAAAAVKTALEALSPDDLSPREALEALYRLKGTLTRRD
ncbi:MAG: DNA mismatch repair protein MutS [Rhizobiales bacterium]|nr:DNA mismatch repair protein MutS [Hyphomicrobiales bacterium]OJY45561.1 MAG: DNA mismatch repair protein MutS [Rhizobiales bacterium 64-17]